MQPSSASASGRPPFTQLWHVSRLDSELSEKQAGFCCFSEICLPGTDGERATRRNRQDAMPDAAQRAVAAGAIGFAPRSLEFLFLDDECRLKHTAGGQNFPPKTNPNDLSLGVVLSVD
jgi:hypothetical protein